MRQTSDEVVKVHAQWKVVLLRGLKGVAGEVHIKKASEHSTPSQLCVI